MNGMNTENLKLFIFDFGNVIVENIYCNHLVADELGIDRAIFDEDYEWYSQPLLDGVISPRAYWDHVAYRFNLPPIKEELFAKHFHPTVVDITARLVKALRAQGKRVVGGTNTYAPHYAILERMGVPALFDKVYASHDIGLSKPTDEFFKHILEAEGYKGEEAFFIDDIIRYHRGAKNMGINTFLFNGEDKEERLKEAFSWLDF